MPKFSHIKNSFLSGELSPKCDGRTDIPQYQHGASTLENFIATPQGGAMRRPGSRYVTQASGLGVRLVPFVFSEDESYMLVFSDGALQIINGTTLIEYSPDDTNSFADLFTADELTKITWVQSADILYIACEDRKPVKISRTAANTFTYNYFDYSFVWGGYAAPTAVLKYPFLDANTDTAHTLTPNATSGTGVGILSSVAFFDASHVGAWFRITQGGTTGTILITAVTDSTHASGTVGVHFSATTASSDWEESAWSNFRGWPRAVTIFEARLIYGGTSFQPDTVYGSLTSNFDIFMNKRLIQDISTDTTGFDLFGTITNADPFVFTSLSQRVNKIQWLSGGKTLAMGTLGAEIIIKGPDPTQSLGPLNVSLSQETVHGSSFVQALRVAYTLVFVQKSGRKIRELIFDFASDSYTSEDISVLSEHMPRRMADLVNTPDYSDVRIKEVAYQEDPFGIIWCIDNNGGLFGCTRDKQLGIAAWHFHRLGGEYTFSGSYIDPEPPKVQSLAVLPNGSGPSDGLWLAVLRTIDDVDVIFIEYLGKEFEGLTLTADDPVFSDASVVLTSGSPTKNYSGVSHLNAATETAVLADGFVHPSVGVTAGAIVLNKAASKVIIGLPYTSKLRTMRIEAGSAMGSAQGSIKRIDRAVVRFFKTVGGKVGRDDLHLEELNFREASLEVDLPAPPYSGDKVISYPSDYDRDAYVMVVQEDPLPMTVLSVISRGVVNEA